LRWRRSAKRRVEASDHALRDRREHAPV
jgi:hypothetical protein